MATRMDPVRVCGVGRKHKDLSLSPTVSFLHRFFCLGSGCRGCEEFPLHADLPVESKFEITLH